MLTKHVHEQVLDAIEASEILSTVQKRAFMEAANLTSPAGCGDKTTQVGALDLISRKLFENGGSPVEGEFEMSP